MSKLYDMRDLSEVLKLSVTTIRKLVRENKLPEPMRVGGSIRWLETDIAAYLEGLRKPKSSN